MNRMWMAACLVLCACAPQPEGYLGTWTRTENLPSYVDYNGVALEYCTRSDQQLLLRDDQTWTLISDNYEEPDDPDCEDQAPDPVVITATGTYTQAEYNEFGSFVLVFLQQQAQHDYEKDKDDYTDTHVVEFVNGVALSEDDEDRWLWLNPMGLFQAAGDAP